MTGEREYAVCGDCGSQHAPTQQHKCTSVRAGLRNAISILVASSDEATTPLELLWSKRVERRLRMKYGGIMPGIIAEAEFAKRMCVLIEGSDV